MQCWENEKLSESDVERKQELKRMGRSLERDDEEEGLNEVTRETIE